ncbi:helix-turn-helix transcriptional regulator [Ligilactobacillus murinus]|nr:helix-turn-helix transcriptional regulator [Ligilactobacillus murinus]
MKIKIENWRDRQGNDLDKARKLLADKNISDTQIVRGTGINKVSINNYRHGKTDIERAKWSIVNRLAQMYDALELAPYIGENGENVIKFSRILNEFFDENKGVYANDPAFLKMVENLETIVSSDPYIMVSLMKPFFK